MNVYAYQYEKKNPGTEMGKQPERGKSGGNRPRRGAMDMIFFKPKPRIKQFA